MNESPSALPNSAEEPSGSGPASTGRIAELEESLNSLRYVFQVTLGVLILLVAAVNVYLWYQAGLVRYQAALLDHQIAQMQQAVSHYDTNSVPWMNNFVEELQTFAAGDEAFAAVMKKYRFPSEETASTNAPATATSE